MMLTVRVYRSEFGSITLKTRIYSDAVRFLQKLDSLGVIAPDNHDPATPTWVYYWIDCWSKHAQPFAEITGAEE